MVELHDRVVDLQPIQLPEPAYGLDDSLGLLVLTQINNGLAATWMLFQHCFSPSLQKCDAEDIETLVHCLWLFYLNFGSLF